ncbi:MAG: hypothetical protein FWD69_04165 [Polyangiaceae bacterium]|nr:hypothetical protein [Polyangiaceae bacterium]
MASLRKPRAAVASSSGVENVAAEILGKGNAVDAVVAGVFAACALSPGVLLGPVQILIGGVGAGLRALDGRVRQPGIGAPRPRGFQRGEEIPSAARVGVPWLPATLSAALATWGTATIAQVLAPALAIAKGSPREIVLSKIASRGPRALEERPISSELLACGGRVNCGLLTADDLASPRPEVVMATRTVISVHHASNVVVTLPWTHVAGGAPVAPAGDVDVASARALVAVDRHGTFAVAVWDEGSFGEPVDELGLRVPLVAEPVLRGVTRQRPGEVRPAAAPIALVGNADGPGIAFAAFGAQDAYDVLRGGIDGVLQNDRIEAHGEARLVAVAHAHGAASVFR